MSEANNVNSSLKRSASLTHEIQSEMGFTKTRRNGKHKRSSLSGKFAFDNDKRCLH